VTNVTSDYDGMLAETVTIRGFEGDVIPAYFARPLGAGPFPGIVVIHHMPGWDEWSKEVTRTFARNGYSALCPHLHHRDAPGASSEDAAKAAREAGGAPDARVVGDVAAAVDGLRALPNGNGKVGVIGHCSGGRHAWLVACEVDIDAAIDCYGGGVVMPADRLSDRMPVAPIDLTPGMRCPLLGLFGKDDQHPSPEQVEQQEAALTASGKHFEFHSYPDAGHAFFCTTRPMYRVEAALEGWERIWEFLGRTLQTT
jgi:carboxymethylenebutenolidase